MINQYKTTQKAGKDLLIHNTKQLYSVSGPYHFNGTKFFVYEL